MSEISEYQPGTPCWLDLWTPDRPAAMDFYATVFGWDYVVAPEEQHFYTTAQVRGLDAAGILTPPGNPDAPCVWLVYLAVDDVDAAAAAIEEHGGQVIAGPIGVPGEGEMRFVLAMDPTGGMFGAWHAAGNRGADVANEPGSFVWNELMTQDPDTARKFYSAVFGLEVSEPMSADFDYTTIRSGGRDVGGIGKAAEGAPAHWGTYFAVADTDATVATVREAGGAVFGDAHDSPYGRTAVCADPQGAVFSVLGVAG